MSNTKQQQIGQAKKQASKQSGIVSFGEEHTEDEYNKYKTMWMLFYIHIDYLTNTIKKQEVTKIKGRGP